MGCASGGSITDREREWPDAARPAHVRLGALRQSCPNSDALSTRSEPESSTKRPKSIACWRACKSTPLKHRNIAFCGAFAKPSDGLEPSTPSLPCNSDGNQSQPTAKVL